MARYAAKGAVLKMSDMSATPVFTAIAQVIDITGPGLSADTLETTDHDSAGWKTYVGSLKDGGEVTLSLHYDPAGGTHDAATGLVSVLGDEVNYQLVFPNTGNTQWAFAAILTAFEPTAPHADKLTASATFKVTGAPTLA
jgi:predicted secreted protein